MGSYFTSEESAVRSLASELLAHVLETCSARSLGSRECSGIGRFLCERLGDYPSVEGSLKGLIALLGRRDVRASVVEGDGAFAARVCTCVARELHVPALERPLRQLSLGVLDVALQEWPEVVGRAEIELGGEGEDAMWHGWRDFVSCVIQSMDGEKDPRCLMVALGVLRMSLEASGADLPRDILDEAFDVSACYFPVSFRPPPDDVNGITRGKLAKSLHGVMGCTPKFAPLALPLLIEKLSSSVPSAKADACRSLAEAAAVYGEAGLAPHLGALGELLRSEVMAVAGAVEEEEDVFEGRGYAAHPRSEAKMRSLSGLSPRPGRWDDDARPQRDDDASWHGVQLREALQAVTALAKAGGGSGRAFFVGPILSWATDQILRSPEGLIASTAALFLAAIARADEASAGMVCEAALPALCAATRLDVAELQNHGVDHLASSLGAVPSSVVRLLDTIVAAVDPDVDVADESGRHPFASVAKLGAAVVLCPKTAAFSNLARDILVLPPSSLVDNAVERDLAERLARSDALDAIVTTMRGSGDDIRQAMVDCVLRFQPLEAQTYIAQRLPAVASAVVDALLRSDDSAAPGHLQRLLQSAVDGDQDEWRETIRSWAQGSVASELIRLSADCPPLSSSLCALVQATSSADRANLRRSLLAEDPIAPAHLEALAASLLPGRNATATDKTSAQSDAELAFPRLLPLLSHDLASVRKAAAEAVAVCVHMSPDTLGTTAIDSSPSLACSALIAQALITRGHKSARAALDPIFRALQSSPSPPHAPAALATALSASTALLDTRSGAVVRPIGRQRAFAQTLKTLATSPPGALPPAVLAGINAASATIDPTMLLVYLDGPAIPLTAAVYALSTENSAAISPALRVLATIAAHDVDHLGPHIDTLAPALVQHAAPPASPTDRAAALACLLALLALPYPDKHRIRKTVTRGLDRALDDPLRHLRRAAVRCRNKWYTMS